MFFRKIKVTDVANKLSMFCTGDDYWGSIVIDDACRFAIDRHAGQMRMGGEPHALHVLRVGLACARYGAAHRPADAVVLALAGILHDTLEDTPTSPQELHELLGSYGEQVVPLVQALSHEEEEEPDEIYLARVAAGGELAVLVKRHDKLDNLRSLLQASAEFRRCKVAETRAALPIWRRIDPEGALLMERFLDNLWWRVPLSKLGF